MTKVRTLCESSPKVRTLCLGLQSIPACSAACSRRFNRRFKHEWRRCTRRGTLLQHLKQIYSFTITMLSSGPRGECLQIICTLLTFWKNSPKGWTLGDFCKDYPKKCDPFRHHSTSAYPFETDCAARQKVLTLTKIFKSAYPSLIEARISVYAVFLNFGMLLEVTPRWPRRADAPNVFWHSKSPKKVKIKNCFGQAERRHAKHNQNRDENGPK